MTGRLSALEHRHLHVLHTPPPGTDNPYPADSATADAAVVSPPYAPRKGLTAFNDLETILLSLIYLPAFTNQSPTFEPPSTCFFLPRVLGALALDFGFRVSNRLLHDYIFAID